MIDFEDAKDKVLMGKERRSIILSDEEKKTTAYHEAGHALVAKLQPGTDPVHKVSIIPRGMALGVTQQLPVDDRHNYSKKFLLKTLAVLLGGRAAEELVFDQLTTGAGNDIEKATDMARKMVCQWGMSEKLGPLALGDNDDSIFLGREIQHHKNFSEETAKAIDAEIKEIVVTAHGTARKLLEDNSDTLHRIADALLERETISGDDIDKIMNGEDLPPMPDTVKGDKGGIRSYKEAKQAAESRSAQPEDDGPDFAIELDDAQAGVGPEDEDESEDREREKKPGQGSGRDDSGGE
jgi:cell division protease FtsH